MSIIKTLFHTFTDVLVFLLSFLPDDPFISALTTALEGYEEWIKYLNYFVPISAFRGILTAWGACLIGLYLYKTLKSTFLSR